MADHGALGDSFAYCDRRYSGRLDEWTEYKDKHVCLLDRATLLKSRKYETKKGILEMKKEIVCAVDGENKDDVVEERQHFAKEIIEKVSRKPSGDKEAEEEGDLLRVVSEGTRLMYAAVVEATRAGFGLAAIEAMEDCAPPEFVRLCLEGKQVKCVASPDVAGRDGGMPWFRTGQVAADYLVFQRNRWELEYDPEYEDICMHCLVEVAGTLIGRMDRVFALAQALFTKGELRRDEITAILGSVGGAPSVVS